ncbi:DUF2127 domain-containing protein [Smaragdicoccus niigatensis]
MFVGHHGQMIDFSLRACSRHGHATFAPDEPELRERLHVTTVAGEAWRCLRCETFVVGPPRGSGPASTAPEVPRGKVLRDLAIMRILAVERGIRGLVIVLIGIGVIRIRGSHEQLQEAFNRELPLIRPLAEQLGWDMDTSKVVHFFIKAFSMSAETLLFIAVGLFVYAGILMVEATGLWLAKRWGEYFAVVATSVFIPLEIYELSERLTVFRIAIFALNIAAVVWLVWSKRLFGINGGAPAYHAEHAAESLLTVEHAAAREAAEA